MPLRAGYSQSTGPIELPLGLLGRLPAEVRQCIYEQYYGMFGERVIYFTHNGRQGRCVVRVNAGTAQHACGSRGGPVFDLVKPQDNLLCLPLACRRM